MDRKEVINGNEEIKESIEEEAIKEKKEIEDRVKEELKMDDIEDKIDIDYQKDNINDITEEEVQALKTFNKALNIFEEQFNVNLDPTGFENIEGEINGLILEVEYWVNDLIQTKEEVDISFKVGGWFNLDCRGEKPNIYCWLGIQLNGDNLTDNMALQSWYNIDNNKWDSLQWDSF